MKTMSDEVKAKAVEFVRKAAKGEDWLGGHRFDMFNGWNGCMSPVSRSAFVVTFGEAATAEVEALAKAADEREEKLRSGSKVAEYRRHAFGNENVKTTDLKAGDFVFATGHGMKFDHQNLRRHLEEMVEFTKSKDDSHLINTVLFRIDRIEEVPDGFFDSDECLYNWKTPSKGEGLGYFGGCSSDDIADGDTRSWPELEQWEKDTFFTLGILIREPSGRAVIIDPQGYDYPRYLYYRLNWATDFAARIEAIEEDERKRREEAAKAAAEEEAKELAAYKERCGKWEHLMKEIDRNAEWGQQVKATKANILAMAKAAAPGVRFSVRSDGYNEYTLSWTNGPTAEELKAATDFDLFVAYVDKFDVYADYWDTEHRKYTEFAERFGTVKNKVSFNRKEAETDRNRIMRIVAEADKAAELYSGGGVTVSKNAGLCGIEIRFNSVPSADVRTALKEEGYRWNHVSKVWYTRDTYHSRKFAKELVEKMASNAA